MVNSEIFRKRLGKIEEYLSILDRLRKYTIDEFVGDPERYGSAERFLHLSIEAINDLGNHMIADLNMGEVNWQSDIPKILFERGVPFQRTPGQVDQNDRFQKRVGP